MTITRIPMIPGYRMLRLAIGQNKHRWFLRIDLWSVGYRITHDT
jgi:hypothetical protein